MITPPPLRPGDTVALLAPSGPGRPDLLEPSVEALVNMGLRVTVMESCRGQNGYLAATDAQRAKDVNEAFANPRIQGLFAWRGGYGAGRLLPLLDYETLRNNPKVCVGYSDMTALHTVFNQRGGFVTYHAPMPATEWATGKVDTFTREIYEQMIFNEPSAYTLRNPPGIPLETVVPGRAEGLLTGGNLCVLASLLGTPYAVDTTDRILFLEETGEEPYRVDRMLLQLKWAGKFSDCRGILLGSFAPEKVSTLRMALQDILIPEQKPILANLACGHCMPTLTLPLGATLYMDAGRKQLVLNP